MTAASSVRLGLRENLPQFSLLVLINAFVGAMVGLERTVVPLLASQEFGLLSSSVALSFLVSFGIVKAGANLAAGQLSDRVGRRRILVAGWVAGLPVAPLIIWAPDWRWIVAANVLLGINQGLCWSTTVIMKIDLVGPRQRGLAMGLNEFAGYLAVSLASLATGYLAARFGLRPVPFYPGIALAVAGLLASLLLVRETTPHSRIEGAQRAAAGGDRAKSLAQVFALTTWKNPTLFASSQAGMVNNLNDAVVWGLVPIVLARAGLPVGQIGVVAATYPAVWGIAQLATGALSDRWGRKWMIAAGMWVQALGIMLFATASGLRPWLLGSVLLGLGTALVYPTLLAAVSDVAQPEWRATSIGVYRLWRDSGYAVGGLLAGILADRFGSGTTIAVVALLTALSGLVVAAAMYETLQKDAHPPLRREEIPS